MTQPNKPCLVACSVLKQEIEKLQANGELQVEVIYLPKYFHVDYDLLEKNLRRTLAKTKDKHPVLVYGDLCLGPNGEMKKLAKEFGIVKIDALNCIDCLLGGKGRVEQEDPHHNLMFFDPGMIEFFQEAKAKLQKEGVDQETFQKMFAGIRGIVVLDTLSQVEKCQKDVDALNTGLRVLEVRAVGVENLKQVLQEALQCNATQEPKAVPVLNGF